MYEYYDIAMYSSKQKGQRLFNQPIVIFSVFVEQQQQILDSQGRAGVRAGRQQAELMRS